MRTGVSFAGYAPVATGYLSRRLSVATIPLDRRFPSSGNRYENTVGPGCQGTAGFIGLVVRAYSAVASRKHDKNLCQKRLAEESGTYQDRP